ncbi:MAG: ATP-binding protein [Myxococcales bacterium]
MPSVSRQSIALRLGVALGAIIFVLGLVSVASLWALIDIHGRLHAVKEDEEKARHIGSLASAIRDQYAHVAHTIIIENDTHSGLFQAASRRVLALAQSAEGQRVPPGDENQVERIVAASLEIQRLFDDKILPAVRRGDRASAVAAHDRVLALAFRSQSDAATLSTKAEAAMEDLNKHVRATQHGAILITILAYILALITAALIGWYLYHSIARPIASLSTAATRLGTGQLDVQVPVERDDELGRLARQFNDMAHAMREHQAELLGAERLAGLGRIAAGIAHELNNPVGVIMGYAKLLLRRDGAVDPKMLHAIEEEAERCQQVIAGLLELTRGSVLRSMPVALRPLVDEVVERWRVAGAAAGVDVRIEGDAGVSGDESKLRQVVTNLVGNALDASGAAGSVRIAIGTGDGVATVTVTDTGVGVPDEDRSHIFEPFFTRKPSGTGLGLSIARAIARAHGGDVALVSREGAGSTFRLTLPALVIEAAT